MSWKSKIEDTWKQQIQNVYGMYVRGGFSTVAGNSMGGYRKHHMAVTLNLNQFKASGV